MNRAEPKTRFRVMVRDPFRVFAYWDLSPADRERVEACSDAARLVILLECSECDTRIETTVRGQDDNWYIRVRPGCHYTGELGLQKADGGWEVLAQCEAFHTPAPSVSERVDPDWHIDEERFYRVISRAARMFGASPLRWRTAAGEEEWAEVWWPLSPLTSSHDAQKKPSVHQPGQEP